MAWRESHEFSQTSLCNVVTTSPVKIIISVWHDKLPDWQEICTNWRTTDFEYPNHWHEVRQSLHVSGRHTVPAFTRADGELKEKMYRHCVLTSCDVSSSSTWRTKSHPVNAWLMCNILDFGPFTMGEDSQRDTSIAKCNQIKVAVVAVTQTILGR